MATQSNQSDEMSAGGNQAVTSSVGSTLTIANLQAAWDALPHNNTIDEVVLIAPNKRYEKQWLKDYPGIKVILAKDYKGHPLPGSIAKGTDLRLDNPEAKEKA
jgi:hypothetical protein